MHNVKQQTSFETFLTFKDILKVSFFNFLVIFSILLIVKNLQASESSKKSFIHFKSTENQVNLIELFTSEGCSSCPPADKYLSSLVDHKYLWTQFVPISFHVDYWDYIGWKDPYASKNITERQQLLASQWVRPSVYTPGFIVNGIEWRDWRKGPTEVSKLNHKDSKTFELELIQLAEKKFQIRINKKYLTKVSTASVNKNLTIHFVLQGFRVSSDVKSGENSGEKLIHDFVALDWQSKNLNISNQKEDIITEFDISKSKTFSSQKMAVVAWLEDAKKPGALQAVGGYLTTPR